MEIAIVRNVTDSKMSVARWNSPLYSRAGRDLPRNAGKDSRRGTGGWDIMNRERNAREGTVKHTRDKS